MNKLKEERVADSDLMSMYKYMSLTQEFESALLRIFKQKGLPEVLHLCTGQEAIGVGACYAMRKNDVVVPSLRARSVFLTLGVAPSILMAGVLGKKDGPSKGKFSAHHMGDLEKGIFSASLCVGSQIPLTVGAALHFKNNNMNNVALTTFGDGATNRGDFHESLNMAAIFKLPILFICENNLYAIDTPADMAVPVTDISTRAQAYNMPGVTIDGNNIFEVYHTVLDAMKRARNGEGPTLIECKTFRLRPHTEYLVEDRPEEEISQWQERCPIKRLREYLVDNAIMDEEKETLLLSEIEEEVKQAVVFAEENPYPDLSDIYNDVFTD